MRNFSIHQNQRTIEIDVDGEHMTFDRAEFTPTPNPALDLPGSSLEAIILAFFKDREEWDTRIKYSTIKMNTIKDVRTRLSCGLKEAKEYIEAVLDQHDIIQPRDDYWQ